MKNAILVISALMIFLVPSMAYAELTTIMGTAGNYTDTIQDDFSVISTAKYWDSSADPIDADSHCND